MDKEEKAWRKRYRSHRCLAGRIYEQLGEDAPEDRESFIQRAETALEGNFQRYMEVVNEEAIVEEIIRSAAGGYC